MKTICLKHSDSASIILAKVNDPVNSVNFTFCDSLFCFILSAKIIMKNEQSMQIAF